MTTTLPASTRSSDWRRRRRAAKAEPPAPPAPAPRPKLSERARQQDVRNVRLLRVRRTGPLSTQQILARYLDTAWRRGGVLAPKTRIGYRDSARFLPKEWPTTGRHIDKSLASIRHLSVASQRTHLRHWKMLGTFAEKQYDYPNPFADLILPRPQKRLRRTFTQAEFTALSRACRDHIDSALLALLFGTGLRIGEVPRYASQITRNAIKVDGKSGEHMVAVEPDVAWLVLQTAIRDRNHTRLWGWLWISPRTGRPLSRAGIMTRWRDLASRAGIKGAKIGPHTARHTFATTWLRNSGDINLLSDQLGHASVRTTEIYTHLTVEDVAKEQQRVSPLREFQQGAAEPVQLRAVK